MAEKFEAMVQLGMTNSRMKDYYDLWFMSRHFEFEGSTLAAAVRATFERRGTVIPGRLPIGLTVEYAADLSHVRQWAAFTESLRIEAAPDLGVAIDKISEFVCRPRLLRQAGSHLTGNGNLRIGGNQSGDAGSFDETPCFHFVVRELRIPAA